MSFGIFFEMSLLNYFKPPVSSPVEAASSATLPHVFVSWNVNGLVTRMQSSSDWNGFTRWVADNEPDVICLQEVKVSAHGPRDCVKGDGKKRDRGIPRDNTKACSEDLKIINAKLNVRPYSAFHKFWSLSDWKYSGVLVLVRKPIKVLQTSFNLLSGSKADHHVDGRVVCLEFENIVFLGTYSPNHGTQLPHWNRRDQWDSECTDWLRRRTIAEADAPNPKPLLWMGDLNVASTDQDLSHPQWFRQQVHRVNNKPVTDTPPDRVGQPGCADAERDGFFRFLQAGGLVDAYRELHKEEPKPAVMDSNNHVAIYEVENNCFSWRGTPGVNDPRDGRFYGKGMRIDHALISKTAFSSVQSVEIVGSGADRNLFWGSDHSAIMLTLKPEDLPKISKKHTLEDPLNSASKRR